MKNITAIILAGGTGERFGSDIPKQFISLNGKPVISYCIDTFKNHPDVNNIVVATHAPWLEKVKELCPSAIVVKGGSTRNESSYNALMACDENTDYVLIHDAVRPFVDNKIINKCIEALDNNFRAVDTIIPIYDTIVEIDNDDIITNMPDRTMIKRGQTPQAFYYKDILDAYKNSVDPNIPFTDDIRLLFNKNIPCKCIIGSEYNIKITTMADLYLAERIAQRLSLAKQAPIDLTGKKCLVFGGTGGIGSAIVDVFRENGAKVIAIGTKDFDLRNYDGYYKYFNKLRSEYGMMDILVIASGVLNKGYLINLDYPTIDKMIDINLKAPIEITRVSVSTIMREGGRIFHIGSSSWSFGRKEYSIYSATKAGIVNFIQAMAEELAPINIKINCINPPRTNTKMRSKAFPGEDVSSLMDPRTVANEIIKYCNSSDSGFVIDLKIGSMEN